MNKSAKWTWLIYMAGDNNLEGAGRDDLAEMKRVGSTDDVNIIVQFDTEQNVTTRYRVGKGALKTLQKMPGVDSGNPKVLTDFLSWGVKQYPAEHYLVDVWNHGGGWENLPADFDYEGMRAAKPVRAARLGRVRRAIFRTTVQKIHKRSPAARAIAIDCGSHDYLDNQELRAALAKAMPGGRKFDIFACDACLMNMFEIAWEMKDTASLMVGSEETEPGAGWPYADILKQLVARPSMAPADLASIVVDKYGAWFKKTHEAATQSALDLTEIAPLGSAIDELATVLVSELSTVDGAVYKAREKAQKFEMPEYIDLADFACQLLASLPHDAKARPAATEVAKLLGATAAPKFVVRNAACGRSVGRANGVSIYFPPREQYCSDYGELAFSKHGRWNQFLKALHA